MQNQKQAQLFAFRLAQKQDKETRQEQAWKARAGVSVAGCSEPRPGELRADDPWFGHDAGIYC